MDRREFLATSTAAVLTPALAGSAQAVDKPYWQLLREVMWFDGKLKDVHYSLLAPTVLADFLKVSPALLAGPINDFTVSDDPEGPRLTRVETKLMHRADAVLAEYRVSLPYYPGNAVPRRRADLHYQTDHQCGRPCVCFGESGEVHFRSGEALAPDAFVRLWANGPDILRHRVSGLPAVTNTLHAWVGLIDSEMLANCTYSRLWTPADIELIS